MCVCVCVTTDLKLCYVFSRRFCLQLKRCKTHNTHAQHTHTHMPIRLHAYRDINTRVKLFSTIRRSFKSDCKISVSIEPSCSNRSLFIRNITPHLHSHRNDVTARALLSFSFSLSLSLSLSRISCLFSFFSFSFSLLLVEKSASIIMLSLPYQFVSSSIFIFSPFCYILSF